MGRTIKLLLYYLIYQFATQGVFTCGYMVYHHTTLLPNLTDPSGVTLLLMSQLIGTLALVVHLLAWKYVRLNRQTLAYYNSGSVLAVSILFIIGMGLWCNYLSELVNLPNNMEATFETMMHHPAGIIAIVVMAPIAEELLFRGAIQGHLLRKWKKPAAAIIVSSLLFGAIHGNPAQIPFAFVLGLALGWIYYRSGSLIPSILMHFINNGTSVVLFLYSDNPDATMQEAFGTTDAICIAAAGVVLTLACIYIFRKKLLPQPADWQEETT